MGLLVKAQPVPNSKDILLTEKLIGKWKYAGKADKAFPDSLEFQEDSILKVASPFDNEGHYIFRIYRYYISATNIYLLTKEEGSQIHIAKLANDSLQIDWNRNGSVRLKYYRIK